MSNWWSLLNVVVQLELRQRVRSVAWYVLLAVVAIVIGTVTLFLYLGSSWSSVPFGDVLYASAILLVLAVAGLVTPALSGAAINGDREAGVLASMQITQISTTQLVLGKWLAAWIASLGFLLVSSPFMLVAVAFGGLTALTATVSFSVLIVEVGVIAALGVGLSGLIRRPIFATAASYLLVAALNIGTLIAFAVASMTVSTTEERSRQEWTTSADGTSVCTMSEERFQEQVPRPDLVWWFLALNPFVVVADSVTSAASLVPGSASSGSSVIGNPGASSNLFEMISIGVRTAQLPPVEASCDGFTSMDQQLDDTVPSWFIGLGVHIGLGALALYGAIAANQVPAKRLAPGSRIA